MPSDIEELVNFIGSRNAEIRGTAVEHLVPYSTSQPAIFKVNSLLPVRNLKVLVQDRQSIAHNALTILVNLSADGEILRSLANDKKFVEVVLDRLLNLSEPNADLFAMLLANLAKWDGLEKSLLAQRSKPAETLSSDDIVLNQLVDLFVKGADGSANKAANFDYLAYLFADLTKHAEIRQCFLQKQAYDNVIPITKLKVFTEHKSDIRRRGVANTIRNIAFDVESHPDLMSSDKIDLLPYIMLPLIGNEEYDEEEMMSMLPDLQLLPPDKEREPDVDIIRTHIEILLLFTHTLEGRQHLRHLHVYPVIRETHKRISDDGARQACELLVQALISDEKDENAGTRGQDDDEDSKVVEI